MRPSIVLVFPALVLLFRSGAFRADYGVTDDVAVVHVRGIALYFDYYCQQVACILSQLSAEMKTGALKMRIIKGTCGRSNSSQPVMDGQTILGAM